MTAQSNRMSGLQHPVQPAHSEAGIAPATNASPISVLLSIDVEEDNWASVRSGVAVENVTEIPAFALFLEKLGVRPTYFVNYQVIIRPWTTEILRELTAHGQGEIGAHLHPWNTPPLDLQRQPGDTMLRNYSAGAQSAKIREVTRALAEAFGEAPTTFRAGRFGVGPETIAALIRLGYRVDSSVTPGFSWRRYDNGPSFRGAPLTPYYLDGRGDVRLPVTDGPLVEVPVSCGLTWGALSNWDAITRLYESPLSRAIRVPSVLARSGLLRHVVCSPETTSARDMFALARRIVSGGVPLIHVAMHATSLRPGLSPFVRSRRQVFQIYARIEEFLERVATLGTVRFRTIGELGWELLGAKAEGRSDFGESGSGASLALPTALRTRSPRLLLLVPKWPVARSEAGLPWTDLLRGLSSYHWELHVVAASDDVQDAMDGAILVHGTRGLNGGRLRRAISRAREVMRRFDPDVLVTAGPPDTIHIAGRRARGSRPIAHVLDLSTLPQKALALERSIASWCERAGPTSPVMILADTDERASQMAQRLSGVARVQSVVGPKGKSPVDLNRAARKLDEELRALSDGWRNPRRHHP